MKLKVVVNIPDGGCLKCPYYRHSSHEYAYQCYDEKDYCRLFGNVQLNKIGSELQRCVACQSCEVAE